MSRPDLRDRNFRHGHAVRGRVTIEYRHWLQMVRRGHDPKSVVYRHYGGRGITVCRAWREAFGAFLADIGPCPSLRHELDRIDSDGNFEPSNVRWLLGRLQNRKRRDNGF